MVRIRPHVFIDKYVIRTLPHYHSHRPLCIQASTRSGILRLLLDPCKWDRNFGTQVPT